MDERDQAADHYAQYAGLNDAEYARLKRHTLLHAAGVILFGVLVIYVLFFADIDID
jgi:hypothetical protein